MNDVAPFVLLACACGAAATTTAATPATPTSAIAQTVAPSAPAPAEAFDDLVALGPALAPGMREIARKVSGEEAIELLRADAGDACVRVAFAAAAPIVAKLVDQGGEVLSSVGPVAEGALGERGPVCVRKGDLVRALAEGAGRSHVRWVVWQAP